MGEVDTTTQLLSLRQPPTSTGQTLAYATNTYMLTFY